MPTSGLQVVEIGIQASVQHLGDLLHRAMLNVIHAFLQIGLEGKTIQFKHLYKKCPNLSNEVRPRLYKKSKNLPGIMAHAYSLPSYREG